MENKVKMSIEDFTKYVEDDNPDLAIADCCFLSTKPNSHHLNISEEVLRKNANTILGKFLIGNMDCINSDVQGHETEPNIFGYFPSDQEVRFIEKNGYLLAYAKAVVSKIYANNFYQLFKEQNFRNTSVEMITIGEEIDGETEVEEFNICGLTALGKRINGSCPDANMNIVQFSENKAKEYYKDSQLSSIKKFAQDRKENLNKSYNVDKSKEAISNDDWSNVDKTTMRNKILSAKNKTSLVKSVYLKVENGWEDTPSEKLGYPVMQLNGDTFVYNRSVLGNARARAVQQNETSVILKLDSIYKKLGLNEERKESNKMADVKEKDDHVVMEEDKENTPTTEDSKSTENTNKVEDSKKMEDDSDEKGKEVEDKKDKVEEDKMGCGEDKMAEITKKLEDAEAELSELRKFKSDVEMEKKDAIVSDTLAKIKDKVDEKKFSEFEKSGKECKFADITAWKNGTLASIVDVVLNKMSDSSDGHIHMEVAQEKNKTNSLWD